MAGLQAAEDGQQGRAAEGGQLHRRRGQPHLAAKKGDRLPPVAALGLIRQRGHDLVLRQRLHRRRPAVPLAAPDPVRGAGAGGAAEQEPHSADRQYEVGRLSRVLGEEDTAAQWFRTALQQDPSHRPSHAIGRPSTGCRRLNLHTTRPASPP